MKTLIALLVLCPSLVFGQFFRPGVTLQQVTNVVNSLVGAGGGTNRVQLINASGGNPRTDYAGVTPAQANTIGLGSFGTGAGPALFFAPDTTLGNWLHSPHFLPGIAAIGSETLMDTNFGGELNIYINGSPSGWTSPNDSGIHLINMSTNKSQSGGGYFINMISSSNGQPPSIVSPGAIAWVWTPTNRIPQMVPGWSYMVGSVNVNSGAITNNMRGFAVSSPEIGLDSGNYSMWMADFINKAFRVPKFTSGKYQPQDGGWVDSFLVDPTLGRVGVGVASANGIPAVDSKFQVVNGASGGLRIGFLETPQNYMDGDATDFRNAATSTTMLKLEFGGAAKFGLPITSSNLVGTTGTPLFHVGTNDINGATVGTNGNVGIGTATPGVALDAPGTSAFGTLRPTNTQAMGWATFAGPTTNYNHGRFIPQIGGTLPALTETDTNGNAVRWIHTNTSAGVVERLGTNAAGGFSISNNTPTTNTSFIAGNNAPSMTFGPGGNVGVGTSTPTAPIHISGATLGTTANPLSALRIENLNGTTGGWVFSAGQPGVVNAGFSIYDGTALLSRFYINNSGLIGIGTTTPRAALEVTGGIIVSNTGSGLKLGPGNATLTNTLYASSTLDFPSTAAGGVSDLPITVSGASDGDIVTLGVPSAQLTGLTGDYFGWSSNGVVYVRFANNNLVTAQDPASGTFKVRVDKFQ